MIIGIVNQTQLSHLSEVVCCAGYIHNIVVVPKLDKKRRKAIIHNRLHNHIDSILLERITDETASYTAADLNYLCNACMEDASASHVAALLDSHQSSFARQFHSVRSLPGGFSALFGVTDLVARVRTGHSADRSCVQSCSRRTGCRRRRAPCSSGRRGAGRRR